MFEEYQFYHTEIMVIHFGLFLTVFLKSYFLFVTQAAITDINSVRRSRLINSVWDRPDYATILGGGGGDEGEVEDL